MSLPAAEHSPISVEAVERHEARVWRSCFEACSQIAGDPLGAVVEEIGGAFVPALQAIDSAEINRVLGLGIGTPATRELVFEIVDFYRRRGRSSFRIELSPFALPTRLPQWLEEAGLSRTSRATAKMFLLTSDFAARSGAEESEVRRLGAEHREAIGKLNALAWGSGSDDVASVAWFGATVGADGFRHYGVFDRDRLVSTGALAVIGPFAWVGFAATHPRYWGGGLRQIINQVRIADAKELGCELVHVEIEHEYSTSPKLPFEKLYDRAWYIPKAPAP
jgi:hypothetical protein